MFLHQKPRSPKLDYKTHIRKHVILVMVEPTSHSKKYQYRFHQTQQDWTNRIDAVFSTGWFEPLWLLPCRQVSENYLCSVLQKLLPKSAKNGTGSFCQNAQQKEPLFGLEIVEKTTTKKLRKGTVPTAANLNGIIASILQLSLRYVRSLQGTP